MRRVVADARASNYCENDILQGMEAPFTTRNAYREELEAFVSETVQRNDALITLPLSLLYFCLFASLVMFHLRVYDRYLVDDSLREWVRGRDDHQQFERQTDDTEGFWKWIIESDEAGISGPLYGDRKPVDCGESAAKQWILASRNILLGDVQMYMIDVDNNKECVWLLHTEAALSFLQNDPRKYKEAGLKAAKALQLNAIWNSGHVRLLGMDFLTYNPELQMISHSEVTMRIDDSGFVRHHIHVNTLPLNPYPSVYIYFIDGPFLVFILILLYQEGADALSALCLGFHEFYQYLEFWNIVDWICIICGLAFFSLWIAVIVLMKAPVFRELFISSDYKLCSDVMSLDVATLDKLMNAFRKLQLVFALLQFVMAANTISVVMKFFKAFQSNDRLRVVTDTFNHSAVALGHFAIIFVTVFMPFVLVAHILFGTDIREFSSVYSSIDTGIQVLMGEFSWYTDLDMTRISNNLPSGVPTILVFIWYFFFMFLVLLVLLNMLLAVVLESYTTVAHKIPEDEKEAIWTQIRNFLAFRRATKNHLSLKVLRRQLENDYARAHQAHVVTVESLTKAFEGMDEANAEWIMQSLLAYKDRKAKRGKEQSVESEFHRKLLMMSAKINELSKEVTHILHSEKEDEPKQESVDTEAFGSEPTCEAKQAEDANGCGYPEELLRTLSEQMNVIVGAVARLGLEQERIMSRLEALTASVAEANSVASTWDGDLRMCAVATIPNQGPPVSSQSTSVDQDSAADNELKPLGPVEPREPEKPSPKTAPTHAPQRRTTHARTTQVTSRLAPTPAPKRSRVPSRNPDNVSDGGRSTPSDTFPGPRGRRLETKGNVKPSKRATPKSAPCGRTGRKNWDAVLLDKQKAPDWAPLVDQDSDDGRE